MDNTKATNKTPRYPDPSYSPEGKQPESTYHPDEKRPDKASTPHPLSGDSSNVMSYGYGQSGDNPSDSGVFRSGTEAADAFIQDEPLTQKDGLLPAEGSADVGYSHTAGKYTAVPVPDAPVGTASDAPVGTASDAIVGTAPDAHIGTVPDAAVGTVPDAAVGTVPDAASGTAPYASAAGAPYDTMALYDRARLNYRRVDRLSLRLILITVAVQLLGVIAIQLMTVMGYTASLWTLMAVQLMPMYIISYPLILAMYRHVPSFAPRIRSLGFERFIKYLLACFPVMYVGNLIGNLVTSPFNGGGSARTLSELLTSTNPIQIIMVVILAPVFEELVFRKAIIDRIGRYGELTAIFLSALIFALFHMNLIQFFYAFGLGLIFAYLYLNTGRIRYTIMLHMLINFFGSTVTSAVISTVPEETWTRIDQFQNGIIGFDELSPILPRLILPLLFFILIFVLCIAGLIVIIANRNDIRLKRTPDEVPLKVAIPAAYGNIYFIIVALLCIGMMIFSLFM